MRVQNLQLAAWCDLDHADLNNKINYKTLVTPADCAAEPVAGELPSDGWQQLAPAVDASQRSLSARVLKEKEFPWTWTWAWAWLGVTWTWAWLYHFLWMGFCLKAPSFVGVFLVWLVSFVLKKVACCVVISLVFACI